MFSNLKIIVTHMRQICFKRSWGIDKKIKSYWHYKIKYILYNISILYIFVLVILIKIIIRINFKKYIILTV
jgi:hypothetical protein